MDDSLMSALKTRLREAIKNGESRANVKQILNFSPTLDLANSDISADVYESCTALHLAVYKKNLDIVQLLVEDFGVNIRNPYVNTHPQRIMIRKPREMETSRDIASYLQNQENIIQLREAIESGRAEEVDRLIPFIGVNSNIAPHGRLQKHYTALHYAAEKNQRHIVEALLIKHDASVLKEENGDGQTPLMVAVDSNSRDVVCFLVKQYLQNISNLDQDYQDKIRQMVA